MFEDILIPVICISLLGLVLGLGLAIASKLFYVKVDERIQKVRDALPGANCGACGYSGCDGFAEAIVAGEAKVNGCPVGGADTSAKIADIMGLEECNDEPLIARVNCGGTTNNCSHKQEYYGIDSCKAAMMIYGGPSTCNYGCIGLGDCVEACPFNAIYVQDGLAKVIASECTGCQTCVGACPKGIIDMVPKKNKVTVMCSSHDKGADARKKCQVACIGCGKCARACPVNAIKVENFLAKIDYSLCVNCKKCIDECPTNAISLFL